MTETRRRIEEAERASDEYYARIEADRKATEA